MRLLPRLRPEERPKFALLGAILFVNGVVLESNEVVATSGFVSRVGVEGLPWVWAADMLVVMLTAGAYSLVVDRARRPRLATALLLAFAGSYFGLYGLFRAGAPDWIPYSLLTILNDQQWIVLPMLLWAMGNDVFTTASAKSLFPLLAMVGFAGGVIGNGITAVAATWFSEGTRGSVDLLLLNGGLLVSAAGVLAWSQTQVEFRAHRSRQDGSVIDRLREGAEFVREVPSYRYLAAAMALLAIGLNVVEYQFVVTAAQAYTSTSSLETFYAGIRAARIALMVVVQGVAAGWLLKVLGFERVFAVVPLALLVGLSVAFFWPVLVGLVVAQYTVRVAVEGVDEPSRRAFLGMVPDERRGRVSAFMDGYPYPAGSAVSCGIIGLAVAAAGQGLLSPESAREIYFGAAAVSLLAAGIAIARFHSTYAASMLNWRLRRRQRESRIPSLEL
jgi:ATP:ADP antiporter, AAA family